MNISLRACEIDLTRDKIILVIEKDGQIYHKSKGWIEEATGADPYCAVADIRNMLDEIFQDMNHE